MSGQTTAAVGAGGAIAAAATGGELAQVFDQLALVLALMGAIGGLTHGLALRLGWREIARGVVIGGALAFGLGILGPQFVTGALGLDVTSGGTVRGLAAAAFLIGFAQNVVVDWMRRGAAR